MESTKTQPVDMLAVSRIILRVVAQLEEKLYSETTSDKKQQAAVVEHDNPPDQASGTSTTQG